MRFAALLLPLAVAIPAAAADTPAPARKPAARPAPARTAKPAPPAKTARPTTRPAGRTARAPGTDAAPAAAPAALCKRALAAHASGDLVRAGLLVPACTGIDALAADARKARIAIKKAADAGAWSPVELVVRSDAAEVTVDAYPDVTLAAGSWRLPPGTYRFTARTSGGAVASDLTISDGIRAVVILTPPPPRAPGAAAARVIDLGDGDGPIAPPIAGAPPKVEHGSLLPARFRKGLTGPAGKPAGPPAGKPAGKPASR